LIPEETNPTQTTPEEPLAPTPVPTPERLEPIEPLDDGGFTPPHGDPLGDAALDLPAEHDHSAAVADFPAGVPIAATPLDSASAHERRAEPPARVEPEPGELLYSGPAEPAPAGDLFANPEPVIGFVEAPVAAAVAVESAPSATTSHQERAEVAPVIEEPAGAMSDQPELLYAGPVEPAPAGLHFPEAAAGDDEGELTVGSSDPLSYPTPEVHDDLEAAALVSEAVAPEVAPVEEPDEPLDGGPNWMLAFICAWSSAISLREAWATVGGGSWGLALRNLGVMGYLLLGVGLLAFAFDALRWGRPRRGAAALVIPTLLTLAGVVCLVLWNDRGRPI